jgi:hypothetical protein
MHHESTGNEEIITSKETNTNLSMDKSKIKYVFDNVETMFVASRGANQAKFTTWKTII